MPLALVTAPSTTPISVVDVRTHLKADQGESNDRLRRLINVAVSATEDRLRRSLVSQTWRLLLDDFPRSEVELPRGDLIAVDSVLYLDAASAEQTCPDTVYEADTASVPGKLRLADGESWPANTVWPNSVKVEFQSGFGPSAPDVPDLIRESLLLQVEALYDYGKSPLHEDSAAWHLIAPYRLGAP